MRQFAIVTLGCKVNQYDGAAVSATLEAAGWSAGRGQGRPDLVIVNTCCVTAAAMAKSRQAIRRLVRRWGDAQVLVCGCYGDYDPQRLLEVLSAEGVAPQRVHIAGHHDDLRAHLEQLRQELESPSPAPVAQDLPPRPPPASLKARRLAALAGGAPGAAHLSPLDRFPGRQRAFVKVQDGCDAFCTYCVVPYTRCVVGSRGVDDVLAECRRLIAHGHREIVLCGVFLGAFGRATAIRRSWRPAPAPLVELVRRVGELPGLWRVRLSSLEPGDLTDELLDVCRALPTFAPHLHLPLQSGSPAVLQRMNRQYTPAQFFGAVARARAALDRPAVSTDVIAGFPGETDDDFALTLELAAAAGFMKIHAFPFSAIPGTAAWNWRDQAAPPMQVRRRLEQLARLEARMANDYRRQLVGGELEAVVEKAAPGGQCRATSDRYVDVEFGAPGLAVGQVARVRIAANHDGLLTGEFISLV